MKTMSDNTSALESLTEIESKLLDGASVASITGVFHFGGYRFLDAYNSWSMRWAIARCPIPRRRLK